MTIATARDVLDFWFAPATEARWFDNDPAFDDAIRRRFGETWQAASRGELDRWADTPDGWLALLIVLDQFSRNLHRGSPLAFAQDAHAQALALAGIGRGDEDHFPPHWRSFAYLPLEHAENHDLQAHCVELFGRLHEQAPEDPRLGNYLDYARRHQAVITRFGRFPHRNAALGRASTTHEQAYLAEPGAGF